jgi:hypothetical protein
MLLRQIQRYFPVLFISLLISLLGLLTFLEPEPADKPSKANRSDQIGIRETYLKMPLSFEANQGQATGNVKFLSRGQGYSLYLTPSETILELRGKKNANLQLRIETLGANNSPLIVPVEELPAKSNYFFGNQPEDWRINIPNYSKVRYNGIYPGVDMVYYGNQRQLEYDFVVYPGARPDLIKLRCKGADKLEIDSQGDLLMHIGGSQVRQHSPRIYQVKDGIKETIAGNYLIEGEHEIGFQVGSYDLERPLIIDPVLSYSTYLGNVGSEEGTSIAVDSAGNAYITGVTTSTGFPTKGARQPGNAGSSDAFVTKLNAAGTALIYSTFLGGGGEDFGSGITVDNNGNAFITGDTTSTNFPTMNPFQSMSAGSQDAFVTRLSPAGNELVYSTYLGGDKGDVGFNIATDSAGSAFVTGTTISQNFPLLNPFQNSLGGGFDAFVAKFNPAGNALIYSTYLGGTSGEFGIGIVVDSAGSAYITGSTNSDNFPVANAIKGTFGGGAPFGDAFVTKFSASGNNLIYSTYLGGSKSDFGSGIDLDQAGNAYVTGGTLSTDFPTLNPLQASFKGGNEIGDAFVTKVSSVGNAFVYSTYLGGEGDDFGSDIAVDSQGNAYVTGSASSTFPTVDLLQNQSRYGGGISDAFVTKLNSQGNSLNYSIFLGGSVEDRGAGIALDQAGSAYVTGVSDSGNLPMVTPFQASNGGARDAFMAKILGVNTPPPTGDFSITISPTTQTIAPGSSTSFTLGLQAINNFAMPVNLSATINPPSGNVTSSFSAGTITSGSNSTLTVNTTASATPGTFTITITGTSGQLVRTQTATVVVSQSPDFALTFNPSTLNVTRKQKGQIVVNINRTGGFTGNVTVIAPDTKAFKIKLTPPTQSTTGTSVSFNFTIKKKAPRGTQQLTFTGRDDTGRVRNGTLTVVVQ